MREREWHTPNQIIRASILEHYPTPKYSSRFDASAPMFVPQSKYLQEEMKKSSMGKDSSYQQVAASKPTSFPADIQSMGIPQPQKYEPRPEPAKQMYNNSALMQSYNLMKMSNEVTKGFGPPPAPGAGHGPYPAAQYHFQKPETSNEHAFNQTELGKDWLCWELGNPSI